MKRKSAVLLMGAALSLAACGYSVRAMTYAYDLGEKGVYAEPAEEDRKKLALWHKEEMRNELAYLACYGVTYDTESDTLYYRGKTVRWLCDEQIEDTYKAIQMPEGEIDVYTVRRDDYRLTGVRIATQEEFDRKTKELEAEAKKEASSTGSILHTFACDEEKVTDSKDGLTTGTAEIKEDIVVNDAEQKEAVEEAEVFDVFEDEDMIASERKIQEYKKNGIGQEPAAGSWTWQGKEIQLLMDEDGSFYQNGSKEAKEGKIYLIVKRKADGSIKAVRQITIEEVMAERIAHLKDK